MMKRSVTFDLINRRTHLYLALFLLPWFFMYGISSLAIHHGALFRSGSGNAQPTWTSKFTRDYHRPVPADADLRAVAVQILDDVALPGVFDVDRPTPGLLEIKRTSFWAITRLTYHIDQNRLVADEQRFPLQQFLIRMHVRAGFQQEAALSDFWAVMIDVVSVGILLWIGSGIYMWWKMGRTRKWGLLAIGCGVVSFTTMLWML